MCRNLTLAFLLVTAVAGFGQEWPRGEVFGGYSYSNLDTRGITHRLDANGWDASATANLTRWVGLEADGAGHYTSLTVFGTKVPIRQYSFVAGPRIAHPFGTVTPFAHGLFGVDRVSANVLGSPSGSDSAFAAAVGGGVDVTVSSGIAVRLLQADFVLTHHSETSGVVAQRNFRVAAGLVFRFGMRAEAPRPAAVPSQPVPTISIPTIGVSGRSEPPYGLRIMSVQPGSSAERAGLRVGDIITGIGGHPLGSGEAVAGELQRHEPGSKVSIRYLRQYWESDVTIDIGTGH